MKKNSKLKQRMADYAGSKIGRQVSNVPKPNAVNLQGHEAYKLDPFLRLLSILHTSKLEPQFYRNVSDVLTDLKKLVHTCAEKDPFLTAQCIVYSRNFGEMRSINHAAAIFIAPFASGTAWGKYFYSLWDKKENKGGCIRRPDDMKEIMEGFRALSDHNPKTNKNKTITNAMKKGFAMSLEALNTYSLLKYKKDLVDVINMVRPNPEKSKATCTIETPEFTAELSTIDAIINGHKVSADTHNVANSEAGQIVAKAKEKGIIDDQEAKELLSEALADNWRQLLVEGKLPIKALLMNLRNILTNNPERDTITRACDLITNRDVILKGKIMPYELDVAHEIIKAEFDTPDSRRVLQSLNIGFQNAVPNLADIFTGNTGIFLDVSGSMWRRVIDTRLQLKVTSRTTCQDKANLLCAAIAKATNADIIQFGGKAKKFSWDPNWSVFDLAEKLKADMGATNLQSAWDLAAQSTVKYDRIVILSDYECNKGNSYQGYTNYMRKVGNPYVYSIDLASYGTVQNVGEKVKFYFGYGFQVFNDIKISEWNPNHYMDKVREIKLY